ncbi:hypothetical protein ACFX1S_032583 [Malus domestica]
MNGRNIRLWMDRWVPSLPNAHPYPSESSNINWNQNVASIIRPSSLEWDPQQIKEIHGREAPIRHRRSSLLASINKQVWKSIWKLEVPPKIIIFIWQILHRVVATRLDLFKRHVAVSPTCPICNEEEESVEHLFLLCPWVQPV